MIRIKLLLLIFLFAFACLPAEAQTPLSIKSIIASADTFRNHLPVEKLYMQFDKPYYSAGDTIWFKAYLFDAAFLSSSKKSGLVHIELVNDTNKVMMERLLPLNYGLGWGNVILNKDDIPEGSYTIRAYTNLMRNFGEDFVFKRNFYVSGNSSKTLLVNSDVSYFKHTGKDSLSLALKFSTLNKTAAGLHEMEIRVLEGKRKTLFRDKVQTDAQGMLNLNFTLPEKTEAGKISLIAEDRTKGQEHKVTIPVPVNRPENMDLQFMPEGGNLVAGIPSRIGFKALDEDGLGTAVAGKIFDGNEAIKEFKSSYKGMGSFDLTPKAGEIYTAKVILPDGSIKSYPLPEVKSTGTTLSIRNAKERDSLEVTITIPQLVIASTTSSPTTATYYLVAQSRGVICYGAVIRSNNQRKLAKALFPSGITKFTILNADRQPVNERIIYIDHQDNLNIRLTPDKKSYSKRDSIVLAVEVKDKDGNPIQGSFSLAVTDDSQMKTDSLGNNILTSVLLTSDLKGTVEDPAHYFQSGDQSANDLDNLLLTQGWKGYDVENAARWKNIFNTPATPDYAAEKEFSISGRVSNVFNKNSSGTLVQLLSSRPPVLKDTITDKNGIFSFSGFPLADTLSFRLQAKNKNDKSAGIGIEMNEVKPPVFAPDVHQFTPWYMNSDTALLKYINTSITRRIDASKLAGEGVLSEVTITTHKFIPGSKNINGSGNADYVVDERDLKKAGGMSLKDYMIQRFGQQFTTSDTYRLFGHRIHLRIDGLNLDTLGAIKTGMTDKDYFDFFDTDDLKGLEVMSGAHWAMAYDPYFIETLTMPKIRPSQIPVFIEITTYSGVGAFIKKTPGTYFYRSTPFVGREEFYRPKYTAKGIAVATDLRSTIHWVPNLITGQDGKGLVSFYAADRPGTYSVIIEGSDMNGDLGRKTGVISIK